MFIHKIHAHHHQPQQSHSSSACGRGRAWATAPAWRDGCSGRDGRPNAKSILGLREGLRALATTCGGDLGKKFGVIRSSTDVKCGSRNRQSRAITALSSSADTGELSRAGTRPGDRARGEPTPRGEVPRSSCMSERKFSDITVRSRACASICGRGRKRGISRARGKISRPRAAGIRTTEAGAMACIETQTRNANSCGHRSKNPPAMPAVDIIP